MNDRHPIGIATRLLIRPYLGAVRNNPYRRIAGIILSIALSAVALAGDIGPQSLTTENGPVRLTASVDRVSARIAERITLSVTAVSPQGIALNFPPVRKKLGDLEVVHSKDTFDIPVTEGRQWTRVYQLESLVSGAFEIPPIAIGYTDRRKGMPQHGTIQSQTIPIRITSVLEGRADPLKFGDIKGVVDLPTEPKSSATQVAWVLSGIGGMALAGLVFALWRMRQRQPAADRWALDELRQLEQSPCRQDGEFHELYFRLTEIVRGYVQRRFGISAPQWTTGEFMKWLRDYNTFSESQKTALAEFLNTADLIKFACMEPNGEEVAAAFSKARDFIRHTTPANTNQHAKEAA